MISGEWGLGMMNDDACAGRGPKRGPYCTTNSIFHTLEQNHTYVDVNVSRRSLVAAL